MGARKQNILRAEDWELLILKVKRVNSITSEEAEETREVSAVFLMKILQDGK